MKRFARTSLAAICTAGLTVGLAALAPVASNAATLTQATLHSVSSATIFGNGPLLVTDSQASQAVASLATTDPAGAAAAAVIAKYPVATWLGEWTEGSDLDDLISGQLAAAATSGTTPVFVVYGIPDRDCGGYSAGGLTDDTYNAWTDEIASDLTGQRAVVIVEPDSLAQLSGDCAADTSTREALLLHEMKTFDGDGVPAYLDAGNSNWVSPSTMAQRLIASGVQYGRGFSSDVSNYYPVSDEIAYDNQVSALTGGAHYVIDTSRSGKGSDGEWCNAAGAGRGPAPRVVSDGTALDALLWVKTPGASDGDCNGGPDAGVWFPSYAEMLVANADLDTVATGSQTNTAVAAPWATPGGAVITSPAAKYTLTMQTDGNLVVYAAGHKAVWSTHTSGHPGSTLDAQTDGNLVIYSPAGQPLWSSHTSGKGSGVVLTVTDHGQATLTKAGKALWQSAAPTTTTLAPGMRLNTGQAITDSTSKHRLTMQSDGNLVLSDGARATWNTHTAGHPGNSFTVQTDGNLVIYSATGKALWTSNTSRQGATVELALQTDGNLVLYKGARAVWNTHTSGR